MNTILTSISNFIEHVAYSGAGLVSFGGMYQPPKPVSLTSNSLRNIKDTQPNKK